ncbi:MAG: hypothetical protein JSS98_06140 [Bacteroidetes bacterium]|nr:hypothetical protein [Bacteroidota bacterium]
MDLKKGKIYKLVSINTNKIYIGSTYSSLELRLIKHINNFRCRNNGKGQSNTTSFELLLLGDVEIQLLEEFDCQSLKQLHSRERYWIEQNKNIVVNKIIPTRTQKEYKELNKEKISAYIKPYCKEYYKNHKDTVEYKENGQKYRNDNKESKKQYDKLYQEKNKEKIKAKKKLYQEKNKEKIKAKKKLYYQQNKEKWNNKIIDD